MSIKKLKQFAEYQRSFDSYLFINTDGDDIFLFQYQAKALNLPTEFAIGSKHHKELLKVAPKFKRTVHTEFVSTAFDLDNIIT